MSTGLSVTGERMSTEYWLSVTGERMSTKYWFVSYW